MPLGPGGDGSLLQAALQASCSTRISEPTALARHPDAALARSGPGTPPVKR